MLLSVTQPWPVSARDPFTGGLEREGFGGRGGFGGLWLWLPLGFGTQVVGGMVRDGDLFGRGSVALDLDGVLLDQESATAV